MDKIVVGEPYRVAGKHGRAFGIECRQCGRVIQPGQWAIRLDNLPPREWDAVSRVGDYCYPGG